MGRSATPDPDLFELRANEVLMRREEGLQTFDDLLEILDFTPVAHHLNGGCGAVLFLGRRGGEDWACEVAILELKDEALQASWHLSFLGGTAWTDPLMLRAKHPALSEEFRGGIDFGDDWFAEVVVGYSTYQSLSGRVRGEDIGQVELPPHGMFCFVGIVPKGQMLELSPTG